MSTFVKSFAAVALFAAALAVTLGAAQAQHWHHHHGWHPYGWGFGAPYFYNPPEFYPPPCHWVRVRFRRHGHWYWRNERRCDY